MNDLMLHLKGIWWDKIKSGEKTEEYRETTDYWKRRIWCKTFENVVLIRGYPHLLVEEENRLTFPWNGYEIKTIQSWENFHPITVEVFAIKLAREART